MLPRDVATLLLAFTLGAAIAWWARPAAEPSPDTQRTPPASSPVPPSAPTARAAPAAEPTTVDRPDATGLLACQARLRQAQRTCPVADASELPPEAQPEALEVATEELRACLGDGHEVVLDCSELPCVVVLAGPRAAMAFETDPCRTLLPSAPRRSPGVTIADGVRIPVWVGWIADDDQPVHHDDLWRIRQQARRGDFMRGVRDNWTAK